jgi:hypothetical protein
MLTLFYIFMCMRSKAEHKYVDAEHAPTNIRRMMSMRRIKKIDDIRQNFQNLFYKILICNQNKMEFLWCRKLGTDIFVYQYRGANYWYSGITVPLPG